MDTRSQQILTWASAFLLGISIQRWLRQWRETATERLHSAVGRAAQWMAAMRAIESLEPEDALFVDDLAGTLAGKRMVRRALHLARRGKSAAASEDKGSTLGTQEQKPQSQRLYVCSEVALTTWWFDRQIMTILTTNSLSSTRGWLSARLRNSARGLTGPPRQVVVVGSGLDARPWRMALPPMTMWLEIDSEDVVKAKLRGLEMCRAEIMPHSNTGYYPLRTARWDIHGADILGDDMDWAKVLSMYGFDLDLPIVWVVENVLMYLPQDGVKMLLEELARVSSAGSLLIGNSTVNRNAELLSGHGSSSHGSYPADIVDHWISSLPLDPQMVLREVGWDVYDSCTQFGIAEQVCVHGSMMSRLEMESADEEEVATDIYFVARKQ